MLYKVQDWCPQTQVWIDAKEIDGVLSSYSTFEVAAFIATSPMMNDKDPNFQVHHCNFPPYDLTSETKWWRVLGI